MRQTFCGKCGARLNEQGLCPVCDSNISRAADKKKNIAIIILSFLIVLIIAIVATVAITKGIASNKEEEETTTTTTTETTTEEETTTTTTTEATTQPPQTTRATTKKRIPRTTQDYYYYDDTYLFPSDEEILSTDYLDTLSKNEIDLIRNEIYARHGYIFKKDKYYNYFIQKDWYDPYEPDMAKAEQQFNSIERKNIAILVKYQKLNK